MENVIGVTIDARHKATILGACVVAAATVAACDRFRVLDVSLGILYIVPLIVSALFLPSWMLVILGIGFSWLREQYSLSPWDGGAVVRVATSLLAFCSTALFVAEVVRRRQLESSSQEKLSEQIGLRQEAEQDARALINSSPAAIITVDSEGNIEIANDAAKRLLGLDNKRPDGNKIVDFFPLFANLLTPERNVRMVRTMVEGNGRRANGEIFFAQMWLSSYATVSGTKLVAVIADASEQLRDREELGLRQLLISSRIIAGAVSHEIRNLAAAADMLHENIGRVGDLAENEDFAALGRLIQAMRRLSSSEVPGAADQALTGVDVEALLRQLKIILTSDEDDVEFRWEIADSLPRVRADQSGLLQVLLNLAQNSRRALRGKPQACITVVAYQLGATVVIRFSDNGPGITSTEALFHPFQPGATSTGLGLYVSRAIVRTYGGELQYIRRMGEGCFLLELPAMAYIEDAQSA